MRQLSIILALALLALPATHAIATTVTYHMELTGLGGTDGLGMPREQFITLSDGSIVIWRAASTELYRSYDTGQTHTESLNLAGSGHNHTHLAVRNDTIFVGQRGPTDGLYLAIIDASVSPMVILLDNTAQYPGVTCNYGALTTGGFYPLPGSSRFIAMHRGADCSFISVDHASVADYTDTATAVIVDASAVADGSTRIGSIPYDGDLYAMCYYLDTAMYMYLYDSTANTWSADGGNAYGAGNTKAYSRFFDVNYWGDRWVMLMPSASQDTVFYTSKQVGAATWEAVQVLATGNDGNESCDISLQRNEATGRLTAVWTYGNASSQMSMWTAYLDPNAVSVDDWSVPEIMVDGDSVTFRTYKYAAPNIVHAAHGDVAYLTYSDNTSNTQRLLWIEYADDAAPAVRIIKGTGIGGSGW